MDHHYDEEFPVDRLPVVAEDLRFEEPETERVGYGRAALSGLRSGAAIGALFGPVFGFFGVVEPLVPGLVLALYGLIFGPLLGLAYHAATAGLRNFSSVSRRGAGRYDLVAADAEIADKAARRLSRRKDPTVARGSFAGPAASTFIPERGVNTLQPFDLPLRALSGITGVAFDQKDVGPSGAVPDNAGRRSNPASPGKATRDRVAGDKGFFGHPRGLATLFGTGV